MRLQMNQTYLSNQSCRMLRQFIETKLVKFEKSFDNWEDAVRASCDMLTKFDYIDNRYVESMIQCIHDNGPYIVIVPGIAMPHSTQGGEGVFKTAISFMKVDEPVYFDEEKYATLFFTLAAVDSEEHLENITKLMELLMNEDVVNDLNTIHTIEELILLSEKYNI